MSNTFNAGGYDDMFALYRADVVVSAPGAHDIVGKDAWRTFLAASLPPNLAYTLRFDTQEMEVGGDLPRSAAPTPSR